MKNLFNEYALSFLKIPYKWGGNTALTGLDCSGYVCECLKAFGVIKGDYSAQTLYDLFIKKNYKQELKENSILFFGTQGNIRHTAIAVNEKLMLEAGGGDQTTVDLKQAITKNALIRIRPINNRKDFFAAFNLEGDL